MGIFKFGLKMLKTDMRQTVLYLLSVIFSAAVLFNAYNIMDNNKYIASSGAVGQTFQLLLLFITALSIFVVFFSNSYFITGKSKEFALGLLSGVNSYKLAFVLFFQTLIIGVVGSIAGIMLGIAAMPGLSAIMYKILGVQGNIYTFSKDTLIVTIIINVFIICLYAFIGDYAYISRREIKDLMNSQKQVFTPHVKKLEIHELSEGLKSVFAFKKDKKTIKPSVSTTVILYFIPVTALFLNFKFFYPMLIIYLVISVVGIQRLLRIYFPEKILELKNGKYAEDKIKLISLSNLHYSLRKVNYLILTLALSTVSLVYIIGIYKDLYQVVVMGIFVYVYSILALGTSILYKFIIEASYRKHIFRQLKLIGYTVKQIKEIIKQEIIMLYGVGIIIPLFHIMIFLIKFQSFGIVTIQLVELLLGIFVGIFLVMIPISYLVYKKLAI